MATPLAAEPTAPPPGPFLESERAGLRLAIRGRFVALAVIGAWLVLTRAPPVSYYFLAFVVAFGFLGLLHYVVIGTGHDRPWVKYVFASLDIALLAWGITLFPLSQPPGLPPVAIFQWGGVYAYFFVVLAVSAFSFSPGLVLYTGVASVAGYLGVFAWVVSGMERALSWGDFPPQATAADMMAVYLDPDFVGSGSRVQETLVLLVTTLLLAAVVKRARGTVRAHLAAVSERDSLSQMFGRYVPESIARALVADRGQLDPVERQATVLFADIADFTAMTRDTGPARILTVLNAYFDAVGEVIGRQGGVITQFQGDAVLATFNVPVENPGHAANAIRAAIEIQALTGGLTFDGLPISVRIGITTGPVVAGAVGGRGRQSYTVHGDTVNVAARLEALNKELGSRVLVSAATVAAAGPAYRFQALCETPVRGFGEAVRVFTISA